MEYPIVEQSLTRLKKWMRSFGAHSSFYEDEIAEKETLELLAERLEGNYPFHHPTYAGQMLKPPARIALLAYHLAQHINPNNHALDGGPPTSEMEKELIAEYAQFFGYGSSFLGHLSSSGTLANLEALWVARNIHPEKGVAFSDQSHYTHERMCAVLGVKSFKIPTFQDGSLDMTYLENIAGEIGTVVVTMGTTGRGKVERLHKIRDFCMGHGLRIHADAAYGGYFHRLAQLDSPKIDTSAWSCISEVDSITVDPHKHGLQPYGCGMVLFKDPSVGRFYKHDSPYTYFSSEELHLGEISLECSRAGASAAALWATQKTFPISGAVFTDGLSKCREAALYFAEKIKSSHEFQLFEEPELDIVCYFPKTMEMSASTISALSKAIFHKGMSSKENSVFVSLYTIPSKYLKSRLPDFVADNDTTVVLRSVFMKPEHLDYASDIFDRLVRLYRD